MAGLFKKVCWGEGCCVDIGGRLVRVEIVETVCGSHSEIVAYFPNGDRECFGGSSNRAMVETAFSRLKAFLDNPDRERIDEDDLWR